MNSFVSKIVGEILAGQPEVPLHEVAVILPNRRACRLVQQELYERNGCKPMFLPRIVSMEDFVSWLSPLRVTDTVTQLLRLRELTREFHHSRFETHQLLSWGIAFLKDISDMDMQLQDVPNTLKEYAIAAKFEIPFGKEDLSDFEREKIAFNELLASIYLKYNVLLRSHGEAYEGMIYRDCAEHISDYIQKITYSRLIFAGFYALSPSELEIIRFLKNHFQTEIFFDIDPFYCHLEDSSVGKEEQRETSFFIRRNSQKLDLDIHHLNFFESNYASIPKTVNIVATSKNMRQIYCAIAEVERIKQEKMKEARSRMNRLDESCDQDETVDMSDTAVVLADEQLMLPFLLSYQPENVTINATMGFPFEDTPVCNLLQSVMSVYESSFALTNDGAPELVFSGELVERLWKHELLRSNCPSNVYFPTVMRYSQILNNEVFENIPKTLLARRLPYLLQKFCHYAELMTTESLYKELWQEVETRLDELGRLFDLYFEKEEIMDFSFARFSVMKKMQEVSISLKGNPETGLQVMGLLETRLMDFKNVIMLSVNEGVLPKGITYNSMLPFDFKFKLDGEEALPNYLYQDQVYAYHFFRLLQRAENVTLIYNNASDASLAEKSRLIAQLEYEVQMQNLGDVIRINHKNLDFNLLLPTKTSFSMPKSEKVMKRLKEYVFSASSLQCYIACPLKFYFRHLMKVRDTIVPSDHLESYELGTVIHAAYKLALDEIAAEPDPAKFSDILQKHIENADETVCRELCKLKGRENLTQNDLNQGSWMINRQVLCETVKKYLERAKTELVTERWKIFANEMDINIADYQIFPIDGGEPFLVSLTGSLDRVQHDGRDVMILDYKTGKVDAGELKISVKKEDRDNIKVVSAAVDHIFTDTKYDKLFQLVLYTLMYDRVAKEKPTSVQVGIVSTREVNKGNRKYILPGSILDNNNILDYKDLLAEKLNDLFCRIYDPSQPFVQTQDKEICKNCDFLHLCGRQTTVDNRM